MKKILGIGILLLFIIGVQACFKHTYTYTLKGRVMSKNTQEPVPDLYLRLITQPKLQGGREELGVTYTNSNGEFVMGNIQTKYNKDLEFVGGFMPSVNTSKTPQNGDTVDLGDIYVNR